MAFFFESALNDLLFSEYYLSFCLRLNNLLFGLGLTIFDMTCKLDTKLEG